MIVVKAGKLLEAQRAIMEYKTFGERLFWARRHHAKLTQQQLRDKIEEKFEIEIGRNYISQMETDPSINPSFAVVQAMAKVLGVSVDWLAGLSQNYLPAQGEEPTPTYFSEEADEVAKIVDSMHPSQRELLRGVARSMLQAPTQRQRERAEIRDTLDSIEREKGIAVRREVEELLRRKGIPIDPAT